MNIRRCRDNRLQHGCSCPLPIWWSASELGCPSEAFSILPDAHWHNPQGTRCWINMCLALLLPSPCQDPDQIRTGQRLGSAWTERGQDLALSHMSPSALSIIHVEITFWLPPTIWCNFWGKRTLREAFTHHILHAPGIGLSKRICASF